MTDKHKITFEFLIKTSQESVWDLLTTKSGLKQFFARNIMVDMVPGGLFEILFDLDQPKGLQGSEGMHVLSMEAPHMFSFSWNAPPHLDEVRQQRTVVQIYLTPEEDGCRLYFVNSGYGQGDQWQASKAYFIKAWSQIVLPRLKYVAETGQAVWQNLDKIEAIDYM